MIPFLFFSLSFANAQEEQRGVPQTKANANGDSLRLEALKAEAGKPSIYMLSFTTRDTLPADAVFELTFPPEFELSQLEVAGSRTMNGGIKLTKDRQKVLLKRTGLGRAVPPGKKVSLKFGLIRNPSNLNKAYIVKVVLRSQAKNIDLMNSDTRVQFLAR